MIQVINYRETDNSITTGFKKYNFVVYGEIGIIEGFTKEQYLQKLYEQCKSSIDYETERYNQGSPNSIVTDLEGEEFIPEEPKLRILKLLLGKEYVEFEEGEESIDVHLSIITKDQYNEDIEVEVNITSSLGEIEDNVLIVPQASEYTEIEIMAKANGISDIKTIGVYPYVEPEPSRMELLQNEVEGLKIGKVMLELKSDTLIDRQDFLEDVITEVILTMIP